MNPAAIGVSTHLGWAAIAVVTLSRHEVRVLRTDRIVTGEDRASVEPFHIAGGFEGLQRVPQPSNPEAGLERGLKIQQRTTARALAGLSRMLEAQDHQLVSGAILMSRGRTASTFEKATGSHTQIHVEEGNAVRESFRLALSGSGVGVHPLDRKSLLATAEDELGGPGENLLARLAACKPENDGAWRKEERLAALAGWIAWCRGKTT